ncbi:MAG: flavoprotein family/uncharacterized flavoprotein family [Bacteroidota bacterium]|jgi:uncharacterized flavoprotein (TIGR03862 family)|nr:flavoprotein family/uncharacterized flavoprotein family [Bacteroidota bacterium]
MLACSLDSRKYAVSIYEKNTALGRKFLVAGKGGFNLTHSEDVGQFAERYTPKEFIEPFLKSFSNEDFRKWLLSLGIETYVGSSKRVFPIKGIKPIEVLKTIESRLAANSVSIYFNHEWKGWNGQALVFNTKDKPIEIQPDITVLALGGASWKVTGSDGQWGQYFKSKDIHVVNFQPSNCAFHIEWPKMLIDAINGLPLKNCAFSCGDKRVRGEAILTEFGIEGSGVYPLSVNVRKQLAEGLNSIIYIDFKPDFTRDEIHTRIENRGNKSIKEFLEGNLKLSKQQTALIKHFTTKDDYHNAEVLSRSIKGFELKVSSLAPLDEAISTVGGISLKEIDDNLQLKKLPNHFCIGEMLDWDAPTGGYLLQACFSMGKYLADKLNQQ